MLIGKELNDAINAQIGREFGASMQYLSIATYFDGEALPRLAQLFYKQAQEEHEHALKMVKYIVETGGEVVLPAIEAPKYKFASAVECFELSLTWENEVTAQINHLYDIAVKAKDYAAQNMLDWFVEEQIEEVGSMENFLKTAKRVGANLLMLEAHLAHD